MLFRSVPVLAAVLLLSACATDGEEKPKPLCPQVAIVRALEKVVDYGLENPDATKLVSVATMNTVEGTCEYTDKGVDVNFTLTMTAEKGPRLGGDRASFPFLISIVGSDDKVRAKDIMTAQFTFKGDEKRTELAQPLHVFIPLAKGEDAAAMRVLTGFQLTEKQMKTLAPQ